MTISGMKEKDRLRAIASTLDEMTTIAQRLRELISSQPPEDLIGYINGQRLLLAFHESEEPEEEKRHNNSKDLLNDTQFLLEYVHAVLASTPARDKPAFDEAACAEIFVSAKKLKSIAIYHAMVTSAGTENGSFGPHTADVEFRIKSTWILLRGNRYQVLEGEFYLFVLATHDAVLREIYGIGASDIAEGFQDMSNAARSGHADAIDEIMKQFDAAQSFAASKGKTFQDVAPDWIDNHASDVESSARAFDDIFRGGTCNVSKHTKLPSILLADLSFNRDEEADFFSEGADCGSPFRTLPVRKRPLIKLGDDYYAVDPCFIRDAGYRALLWNILQRRPDYKKEFESRQKAMSEAAFFTIFQEQLAGADVHQEVYYKDPTTNEWVENDTLITIDDMLILVEAKSGAAATIASPALDFPRHVQSVQELIVKAYKQCKRFFEYLNSAVEVSIFRRIGGKYVECGRIKRSNYRILLPIGLTVESFSPVAAMCKELPDIDPILMTHPFISLSIDDLFVLKRFLPTAGHLAHYLEVRQKAAGIKGALLFDEIDHLGAYIKRNRFDLELAAQRMKENVGLVVWDGMSEVVDKYFEGEIGDEKSIPTQEFPDELLAFLNALNKTRAPGWLITDGHLRDYDDKGRRDFASTLITCRRTLEKHSSRYFSFSGERSLFIWLQRSNTEPDLKSITLKSAAAALAMQDPKTIGVIVTADADGNYENAKRFDIDVPTVRTPENLHVYEAAAGMLNRPIFFDKSEPTQDLPQRVAHLGRNERCWCGSGLKFKKCHGRSTS